MPDKKSGRPSKPRPAKGSSPKKAGSKKPAAEKSSAKDPVAKKPVANDAPPRKLTRNASSQLPIANVASPQQAPSSGNSNTIATARPVAPVPNPNGTPAGSGSSPPKPARSAMPASVSGGSSANPLRVYFRGIDVVSGSRSPKLLSGRILRIAARDGDDDLVAKIEKRVSELSGDDVMRMIEFPNHYEFRELSYILEWQIQDEGRNRCRLERAGAAWNPVPLAGEAKSSS